MTEAVAPVAEASLASFSHERRGCWPGDDGLPVDVAEEFHEASKMRAGFSAQMLGPAGPRMAAAHDVHLALGRKSLTCHGPRLDLPEPGAVPVDLLALARARRSGLPEPSAPIALTTLSTVLAGGAGAVPGRPERRVTPSAGALHPLDVLVIAHAVTDLERGTYVYDPIAHALLPRCEFDPDEFHRGVGESIAPPQPAVTLALVASFARSRAKYGVRGHRFCLIEAGHLAQSLVLVATALGLSTLPWGGYIDDAADRLLELDGLDRSCVYLVGLSATGSR